MDRAMQWMDLFYTPSLVWVRISDGGIARIGLTQQISDYLKSIDEDGSIRFRLKPVGTRVKQMETLGLVDVKNLSFEISSPLSGIVKSFNGEVLKKPVIIYEDPETRWIVEVEAENIEEEAKHLLSPHHYRELCRNLWYFLRIQL
jgi:glycine cleavage system H lipoate-binding protein